MQVQTPEALLNQLEDIDRGMLAIRFNPYISNLEKINILEDQMNIRNEKYQEYLIARANNFKEYINSLHLNEIGITPYYPVPQRARLTMNDTRTAELGKVGKMGPFERMTYKMSKMNKPIQSAKDEIERLRYEQSESLSKKKVNIREMINELKKQKIRTSRENAHLIRLEAELAEIQRFQAPEK